MSPGGTVSRRRAWHLNAVLVASLSILGGVPAVAFQFQDARPGYAFSFPRDHASHDAFRTEWWYYSGLIAGPDGQRFGYQLTFFRSGVDPGSKNPSRWTVRHLYLAHFAVADLAARRHVFFEKMNRAGIGWAGSRPDRLHVWNEDWSAEISEGIHRLRARGGGYEIQLDLEPFRPPVIHGRDGVSRKGNGPGEASHYVSLTRMKTTGILTAGGRVIPVKGESWMDHEFTSADLSPNLAGWDWLGLRLSDGSDLMIYRLRARGEGSREIVSGTLVRPDGAARSLEAAEIRLAPGGTWKSPGSGAAYPVHWRVEIPGERIVLDARAVFPEQELVTAESTRVTYWEGVVDVSGESRGKVVTGEGYLEMTGRARPE
ncbi:MAG: hypothetical protein A2V83_00980 [Nitrospirae bacterium RBG_16_64_22]|nr:MAG: hypothetical protein A2V83_00980 [Nitrospirae bacterium RBG_16_64_22]